MVSGHFVKMSPTVQKKHKFPSLITFLVNVYLALPIVSTWVAQYQSHQMFVSCYLLQDSFSSRFDEQGSLLGTWASEK